MPFSQGVVLAAAPGSSESISHLVSVTNGDQTLQLPAGLYAISSDAAAGVTACVRLGAAAVMPALGASQPGVVIPAGSTRLLLVTRDDCGATTGTAPLHYLASAAGPSNVWIVRVVPL